MEARMKLFCLMHLRMNLNAAENICDFFLKLWRIQYIEDVLYIDIENMYEEYRCLYIHCIYTHTYTQFVYTIYIYTQTAVLW